MGGKPPVLSADNLTSCAPEAALRTPRPVPGSQTPPPAAPAPPRPPSSNGESAKRTPPDIANTSADEPSGVVFAEDLSAGAPAPFRILQALPSWFVSALLHMLMILVMALLYLPMPPIDSFQEVLLATDGPTEELEEIAEEVIEPVEIETTTHEVVPTESATMEVSEEFTTISTDDQAAAAAVAVELSDISEATAPRSDLLRVVGAYAGTGLEGRGEASRARMVREAGGTAESEAAVSRSLKWFSKHQYHDGGWSFNHQKGPCQSRCKHPGSYNDARTAATAMALLPYLGAGQTHTEGEYKEQVRRGLYFLIGSMQIKEKNLGDLTEPNGKMYSHALATIALSEAYGMTLDNDLIQPAQFAVNYLVWAQNKSDGGWRYAPNEPLGDTSVVGWALMALKSAHMAYHLQIDTRSVQGAILFLDTVQLEGGSKYSYVASGGPGPATTAIGLLCRMYTGWEQDHPALQSGVDYLAEIGPLQNDFYYKYYATQVMRHTGGARWTTWNESMREHLISTQSTEGHEEGSWYAETDGHSPVGGRHYCTSMATMILEVYYRHMPVYGARVLEEEFPL